VVLTCSQANSTLTGRAIIYARHVQRARSQACQAVSTQASLVIGNSPDIDRVQVQWDDTGEITHCLKANPRVCYLGRYLCCSIDPNLSAYVGGRTRTRTLDPLIRVSVCGAAFCALP